MFYSVAPSAALQPFVETVWYCNRYLPVEEKTLTLPLGRIEMVIRFSGDYSITHEGTQLEAGAFWITGQPTGAVTTSIRGRHECMGAVFTPLGWSGFSKISAGELTNQSVDVDAVLGRRFGSLREELVELKTAAHKCKAFENVLAKRLNGGNGSPLIREAMSLIQKNGFLHKVTVSGMAGQLKVSRKTLNQHFQKHVGLSASAYLQHLTCNAVLQRLCRVPDARLIETGYEFNFFDQAHFIRQFQAFAGMTPGEYRRLFKQGAIDKSFPNFITA